QTPSAGPTMTCPAQAGAGTDAVLTDVTGTATCSPVFGGKAGVDGTAYVSVGGAYTVEHLTDSTKPPTAYSVFPSSGKLTVRVTSATIGSLSVVSGSGQSAQAGASLANPLVASVLSTSGTALAGQQVNWTVSPSGAATLASTQTTTDSNGQ